jgi:hypothetical protein
MAQISILSSTADETSNKLAPWTQLLQLESCPADEALKSALW